MLWSSERRRINMGWTEAERKTHMGKGCLAKRLVQKKIFAETDEYF